MPAGSNTNQEESGGSSEGVGNTDDGLKRDLKDSASYHGVKYGSNQNATQGACVSNQRIAMRFKCKVRSDRTCGCNLSQSNVYEDYFPLEHVYPQVAEDCTDKKARQKGQARY